MKFKKWELGKNTTKQKLNIALHTQAYMYRNIADSKGKYMTRLNYIIVYIKLQ